ADRPAEGFKVSSLLNDLTGLRAEPPNGRLWAEKATDRELERFGLKPPRLHVTVTLSDEKDKERAYLFGAETDDKAQVYAKQGERDLVFSVRKGVLDDLQQTDLSDPNVLRLDLAKVNGMRVTVWKHAVGQEAPPDRHSKGADNLTIDK